MKRLFLTASLDTDNVAESVSKHINISGKLKTALILTPVEAEQQIGLKTWEGEEREALNRANFSTFDYTITGKNITQIKSDLNGIDVLYISGGKEFYFREKCNESNFEIFVKEFVDSGRPYIGTSCGSIMAGKDISATLKLNDLTCLKHPVDTRGFNLVDFSILPHWGLEDFKTGYTSEGFEDMYKTNRSLVAINNYQYIEVIGDNYRIVDLRKEKL